MKNNAKATWATLASMLILFVFIFCVFIEIVSPHTATLSIFVFVVTGLLYFFIWNFWRYLFDDNPIGFA